VPALFSPVLTETRPSIGKNVAESERTTEPRNAVPGSCRPVFRDNFERISWNSHADPSCVAGNQASESESRVAPIIQDLDMLRGMFFAALRKGTAELKALKEDSKHFLEHDYDLMDMDFRAEAANVDGIHFITPDVKGLITLSEKYANDRTDANLQAIQQVRPPNA
jgi:hypothetical protein